MTIINIKNCIMKTKNIVITLFLAIMLVSCSNSSELKFLGKNLSVSCEEFNKHLEKVDSSM